MTEFNTGQVDALARILRERHGFSSTRDVDLAISALMERTDQRLRKGNTLSISRIVRGLSAMQGKVINPQTVDGDVAAAKALDSGTTPGSYLIPMIQADQFIEMLSAGGVLRAMQPRIWNMTGMLKLTVPTALASPTFEWLGENTAQTASDPNLGQLSLSLKTARALIAIPNELLSASVPQFDTLIQDVLAKGAAEHEDTAAFATTSVVNGPTSFYAAANTTSVYVGSSANGGNIGYSDVISVISKAFSVKAKPPFCWLTGVRTFYQRILGLVDSNSRPLVVPTMVDGLTGTIRYSLMGWPVYVSPFIKEDIVNGSGSSQSWMMLTNPQYLHVGQSLAWSIAVSLERFFELNETAIRMIGYRDFGVSPAAGVCILKGIN